MENFITSDPPLRPEIILLPVDSADGSRSLQVPIFIELFIILDRPCNVCLVNRPDVVHATEEAEERWATTTLEFPGDWKHRVRFFLPPSFSHSCGTFLTCLECMSHNIATNVDEHGQFCAGNIRCIQGCDHIYTHEEIRTIVVDPEIFERYDKYCLLSSLTNLPNFRWCLRMGCKFGQVHDVPREHEKDGTQRNRVVCNECGFAMCFLHQVPWHEGLSCMDIENLPEEDRVKPGHWLGSKLIKDCPACQSTLEKVDGCDHMICHVCKFEFCWGCGTEWEKIVDGAGLGHVWQNHKEDCEYRNPYARHPATV
ncbi:hypothetical protein QBC39DRAFT_348650 [Podospora conica]|nr:hypothetical protein QBC39DRAFT_348650 [Schizothecium conicum]